MEYIRFPRAAAHPLVGLLCKSECTLYDFSLLAVVALQITVKHLAERLINHPVFRFSCEIVVFLACLHRLQPHVSH